MKLLLCCSMLFLAPVAGGAAAAQGGAEAYDGDLARHIRAYVEPLVALDVFSGVVLVARADRVVMESAYGLASREHDVAMRADHAFRIASISKSFTRALFGILADRGRAGLDDAIDAWLPDFPGAERITIRMLLDHRAGVPNVNALPYDEDALTPNTLAALVDSLAGLPLDFTPGEERRYSNGGYAVLARIVELVEGRAFDAVLRTLLLEPLGLESTTHEADGDVVPDLATGYMPHAARFGELSRAPFQEMATKTGGGSLVSTARDLHRWAAAIGRSAVLSPATWQELFPHDTLAFSGRSPGYNAYLLRDRATELTVVVLANNYAAGAVSDIAEAALALAQGAAPRPLAVRAPHMVEPSSFAAFTGEYSPPDGVLPVPAGALLHVLRIGHDLVLHVADVPIDVLVPQGERTFLARALWSLVEFEPPAGGRSPGVAVRALYRDAVFHAPRRGP